MNVIRLHRISFKVNIVYIYILYHVSTLIIRDILQYLHIFSRVQKEYRIYCIEMSYSQNILSLLSAHTKVNLNPSLIPLSYFFNITLNLQKPSNRIMVTLHFALQFFILVSYFNSVVYLVVIYPGTALFYILVLYSPISWFFSILYLLPRYYFILYPGNILFYIQVLYFSISQFYTILYLGYILFYIQV